MRGIARDRLFYLTIRSLALVLQLGAIVCLTPIKLHGAYPERIVGFVALSLIAWFLNLCAQGTGEYRRRTLASHLRSQRRQAFVLSVLASVFAVMSVVYLQIVPTWPILAVTLSLGGCAGYALTNA
jgi:hypothetical protein